MEASRHHSGLEGPNLALTGLAHPQWVAASQELLSQSSLLRQTVEVAVVFLLPPQSCRSLVEETHLIQEKGSLSSFLAHACCIFSGHHSVEVYT